MRSSFLPVCGLFLCSGLLLAQGAGRSTGHLHSTSNERTFSDRPRAYPRATVSPGSSTHKACETSGSPKVRIQAASTDSYMDDDGQELSEISFSADGHTILYVRGGGKNAVGEAPNPTSNPAGAEQAVWAVELGGRRATPRGRGRLAGDSPHGDWIAYVREGQIWLAAVDGAGKPEHIVVRGKNSSPACRPTGDCSRLSQGAGSQFHRLYDTAQKTIRYLAPSVDTDSFPKWSADGKQVAFVRRAAAPRDTPVAFFIAPDVRSPGPSGSAEVSERLRAARVEEHRFPGRILSWNAGKHHQLGTQRTIIFASEQEAGSISTRACGRRACPAYAQCEFEHMTLTRITARLFIPGKDSSRKSVLFHTGRAEPLDTSATQMAQDPDGPAQ